MNTPFSTHGNAALAALTGGEQFNQPEGRFLGGIAFTDTKFTEKQIRWLEPLLRLVALLIGDHG